MKPDPMEEMIAKALTEADIHFMRDVPTGNAVIDFYIPNWDVYIEVKRFYSDRIDRQASSCENLIVAQGKPAVQMLAHLIRNRGK